MLSDSSSSNLSTLPTCFRKKHHPLKHLISTVLISTGANVMVAGCVVAQEIPVEEILVQDIQRDRYLVEESSVGKYTEPLLNTPQAVTTISYQMQQDRNAMSLDDALRNVPGITLGAGEFSWQGNNPTIRGFSSRNDMFLDGIRDTGNYARDPFNLESVEVLLGPSLMVFGRGSTGGVINQSSKKPVGDEIRSLHMNVGNAGTLRATVDFNQPLQIGENAGFRVSLLAHEQDVPGRDVTTSKHYGVAHSFGPTEVKLRAGDIVLYPGTSIHGTKPVTRGKRLAAFFWIQSMVRSDKKRSILFELDKAIQEIARVTPDQAALTNLAVVYQNL